VKALVEALASDACEGRAPGTRGGLVARALVVEALRAAGLDPFEQPVPGCRGANVLARVGDGPRWILVGAHYDHLGRIGRDVYPGADDNAAAVAILVEVARALVAERPNGRGVLFAAFDGEEPPHFLTDGMGSEHFAKRPNVPLESIDLAIVMDLVGHALGGSAMPRAVRETVFALGSERGIGYADRVDRSANAIQGVVVRRADAELIPPLSDYEPFWRRGRPFLFLTSGRNRRYHTPADRPDGLDFEKMAATARWVERFVRLECEADSEGRLDPAVRDDASTLRSLAAICAALEPVSEEAAGARAKSESLLARCDANGRLPEDRRFEMLMLAGLVESKLG
jgi:hypothetical protein